MQLVVMCQRAARTRRLLLALLKEKQEMHKTRATIAFILVLMLATIGQVWAVKNVILMIGDGMGPNQVKAGSYYLTGSAGNLCFEQYLKASVTTYSASDAITDSAAAATALATGHKTNNGIISQSPTGTTYQTILEKAKSMGKSTGIVTTDAITGATPAGFAAHDSSRTNYLPIAGDYISASQPNIIMGGGGTSSGGSGFISTFQIGLAKNNGYTTVYNKTDMNALSSTTQKTLGLFNVDELTYEYDRTSGNTEPHLSEMTSKALSMLSTDSDGFFVMIEGGKIDHGCHSNLIERTTKEVVEFNNSVQAALNWMQGRDDTMLIVTADHETGGLSVTSNGAGHYATASWTTTGHSATNVPFYITGAGSNLANQYITNGIMDNTNVYNVMYDAMTTVPEPSSLVVLLVGACALIRRRRK